MPRGNQFFEGGKGSIQGISALGTSTVTTVTRLVGCMPKTGRVTGIRFYGQAATTATALTAEVKARPTDGGTAVTLQSAATDVDLTAAQLLAGVEASLTTTYSALKIAEGQAFEVTITANTCTAGPGDFLVEIEFQPLAK